MLPLINGSAIMPINLARELGNTAITDYYKILLRSNTLISEMPSLFASGVRNYERLTELADQQAQKIILKSEYQDRAFSISTQFVSDVESTIREQLASMSLSTK